ncbi:glycosyltransferase [Paenibacillus allorhizosphaerae]|uniref:glycosyltransferase n=2 Tax=Paenibacillus allorhizosphaerae TaxID=2849866 RepID=UPI00361AD850
MSKSVIKPLLPTSYRTTIKKKLLNNAYPITWNEKKANLTIASVQGVNLVGYSRAEMGIGESCRIAAKSLDAASIPFGIINFTGTNSSRMTDTSWIHKEIESPKYNVNVYHVNAEQTMEIYAEYGSPLFENRYNIGYWHWELPDFPDEWSDSFKLVNEVWVPSTFVADSISIKSPVPVVKIPHSIEVKYISNKDRTYFNLPDNSFLFLTMYDVKSYQERKNPRASVEAFKTAFEPNDLSVGLVIKINTLKQNLEEIDVLNDLIADYKNIYLIKETLNREDTNALISVTDSYISLHRSEGFGLGLAEAMYLGKPVIGTNWSSNTDFMNQDNSCLVNYKLIPVGRDYGPYKSYQVWADPDINHASYYMKRLVTDVEYRQEISKNGENTIKTHYSPKTVGTLINKRLQYINSWYLK